MRLMTNSADKGMPAIPGHRTELRERLAALEHEQWTRWTHTLAESEPLSAERLYGWNAQWVPYDELSEADKDLDREWADRVIEVLNEMGILSRSDQDGATPGV